MRETTQVTPEAREGKPRVKIGRNTQRNSASDHQDNKPVKMLKVSDSGMHLTQPNGKYLNQTTGAGRL